MLSDVEKGRIRSSWRLVVPIAETVPDLFYRRLFELAPQYRVLFPDDLARQKRKLLAMLKFVVASLDWTADDWKEEVAPSDDLALILMALGRRHHELYRIPDESYAVVGEVLIWTLDKGLGQAFTPRVREAWTKLYDVISASMRIGAQGATVDIDLGRSVAR
ncbi:MAG: hypothetical protein KTR31_31650 [Myxococcales bacterium]|nr:hypothetical protein [Myxococcales bacterium]